MNIEFVQIEKLVPYARNARVHPDFQVSQLVSSVREWGWTNPMLVDVSAGHIIVSGHGRRLAAMQIFESENPEIKTPDGKPIPAGMVPIINCSGWTESKRRAYILADNKIALNATWDEEMVAAELQALKDVSANLLLSGFDDGEIEKLTTQFLPSGNDSEIPPDNKDIDEEGMKKTENECPKCHFQW